MIYGFGDFRLDDAAFTLEGPEGLRAVEPLVFDLILCFARNPGKVLTRDALIEEVWKGRIVSDATLSSAVKSARRALDDDGDAQRMIRTVRGRGFQFAVEVERSDQTSHQAGAPALEAARPEAAARRAPWRPSLRVGPFRAIAVTPELGGLADAMAGNLTTILTRIPVLEVVADTAPAEASGLQLRANLEAIGENVQANLQLLAADTGRVIWARMFESPRDDDAGRRLLRQILPWLEPQLMRALHQSAGDDRGDLGANQLTLKAAGVLYLKGWSRATFDEAAALLRRAIALDERLALAHAHLSLALGLGGRFGILREPGTKEAAEAHAQRALDLDDMDASVVGFAGCALADIGQPKRARPLLKRAIELDPNNPQGWAALGALQVTEGELEAGVENLSRGLEISPIDPRRSIWGAVLAMGHLLMGDAEKAAAVAEQAAEAHDRMHLPRVILAAARLATGDTASAEEALADARRTRPDLAEPELARIVGEKLASELASLPAR